MNRQQFLTKTFTITNHATPGRGVRRAVASLIAAWIVATAGATPATAQVFEGDPLVVDNAGDAAGGEGLTLREAIALAMATPSDEMIVFADHVTEIRLQRGALIIGHLFTPPDSGWLMIDGGGDVTLDAGGRSGVMEVQSGNAILTGLAFVNGSGDIGAGLLVWGAHETNVTLENSLVAFNTTTGPGGGILTGAVLTMTDTLVSQNYSRQNGGGVFISGEDGGILAADNSAFWGNESRWDGGGIFNLKGELLLNEPSVLDNTARNGGGIYNDGGHLSLSGGQFSGNQASRDGNDVYYTSGSADPADLAGLDVFEEAPKGKGGGRR